MRFAAIVLTIAALSGCSPSSAPASEDDFLVVPGLGSTRIDVPRPSGPTPAACEPLAAGPTDGQTTQQRVAGLRNVGFFDGGETDAETARGIDERAESEYGRAPNQTDPIAELMIAAMDDSRVWWGDLEADVHPSNAVYENVLEQWRAISLGAFAPAGIEEVWASEQGPVRVSITLGDRPLEVTPAILEDWIDPRILTPINAAIAASGRQFELYRSRSTRRYSSWC